MEIISCAVNFLFLFRNSYWGMWFAHMRIYYFHRLLRWCWSRHRHSWLWNGPFGKCFLQVLIKSFWCMRCGTWFYFCHFTSCNLMWSKSCIRSNWCYGKFFEVSTCNLSMNIGLYREIFFFNFNLSFYLLWSWAILSWSFTMWKWPFKKKEKKELLLLERESKN